ncbi:MAG: hypothetical protein F6K17_01200 [Okeania sp. SIO3C4]|nr:hypothetical protein [Okeania sp. SIO3C4]
MLAYFSAIYFSVRKRAIASSIFIGNDWYLWGANAIHPYMVYGEGDRSFLITDN